MSKTDIRQRVGIYGGTFNPIHIGHLLIAENAREQLQLGEIRFIPAFVAPHKLGQPTTDSKQRAELIRLAISGNTAFALDERELNRGGTSFTVDTLKELKLEQPDTDFVFLMGADSLADLHTWRDPRTICELAFIAIVARGGMPAPNLDKLKDYLPVEQHGDLAKHLIKMPQIEISSSDIRDRVRQNKSIRYQVPGAVEAFIRATKLYA
jgi:nicotinate-nucleotide adenylyltransferase